MEDLTPQQARRMIDLEGAKLIDCRERVEWEDVRIAGVPLVPLSEYDADRTLVERADKTIFVCAAGVRSKIACAFYEKQHSGAAAYNLEGGISAWAGAGLPVETGRPES
jgi:rhodanese-related sulfurtransferase